MATTEAALVDQIRNAVTRRFGGLWVKIHGGRFQERGLPDLIGLVEGVFFGLEVKLPGRESTLSPAQAYQIERITQNGGHARMVTSIGDAIEFVESKLK